MSRFFLQLPLFLIFCFLISCTEKKKEIQIDCQTQIQNDSTIKEPKNKEVILGYVLGEYREAFDKHTAELKKQNKVSGTREISCMFDLPGLKNARFIINPVYHNDSLLKVSLKHSQPAIYKKNVLKTFALLKEVYRRKYGKQFCENIKDDMALIYWLEEGKTVQLEFYKDEDPEGTRYHVTTNYFISKKERDAYQSEDSIFDNDGNSMNKWYYKKYVLPKDSNNIILNKTN